MPRIAILCGTGMENLAELISDGSSDLMLQKRVLRHDIVIRKHQRTLRKTETSYFLTNFHNSSFVSALLVSTRFNNIEKGMTKFSLGIFPL